MDDIRVWDFVVRDRPGARTIGLVYKVKDGRAGVWWHIQDKPSGEPQVEINEHMTSELKVVGRDSTVPSSMIALRENHFPNKPFRTRL